MQTVSPSFFEGHVLRKYVVFCVFLFKDEVNSVPYAPVEGSTF